MISTIKFIVTFPFRTTKYIVESFGDIDHEWNVVTERLTNNSVVISGGAGNDISFELNMIEKIGVQVHLFDPSPTGIATLAKKSNERYIDRLVFVPKALSGVNGFIYLDPPDDSLEGSWKASDVNHNQSAIEVPSAKLSGYCASNDIHKIDLLKIDIEGAEYDVIDDILNSKIYVDQLCLEFHSKAQIGIKQTYFDIFWYIFKLYVSGFRIAYITKSDFTLIKIK